MGYGSASDHLDLLAAPGLETAVLSLLGDWLSRPGGRLLDLKGIRVRIAVSRSPTWPCSSRADGRGTLRDFARKCRGIPVDPLLAVPPESSSLRRPSQCRRGDASDRPRSRCPPVPRDPARAPPCAMGGPLQFLPAFDRFVAGCAGGSAADEVVVHELVSDDNVVATVMAFEVAGRVSLYQSARHADPRWRDATTVLLAAIIDDACDRGFSEVDFLRGEEPYKGRFAPNRREMIRLVAGKGFVGRLGCVAIAAKAHAKGMAVRGVRFGRSSATGGRTRPSPGSRPGRSGRCCFAERDAAHGLRTEDVVPRPTARWPRPWLCRQWQSAQVLAGSGESAAGAS